jgi:hypothetical protein
MDMFLDPVIAPTLGAKLSVEGQPLNRIIIPPIKTLIYSSNQTQLQTSLQSVIINQDIQKLNLPSRIISEEEQQIGIVIENNMGFQPTPGSVPQTSAIPGSRAIPTDYTSALANRHLISQGRASKNVKVYNKAELVQLAKNLQINALGKKDELSNRILAALDSFFDKQSHR